MKACQMCSEAEKYNGWTNYETWAVALWLSNDQDVDEQTRLIVAQTIEDFEEENSYMEDKIKRHALLEVEVANAIENFVKESKPDYVNGRNASMFDDLLDAALSEVDWMEIAKQYVDDYISEHEREKMEQ